MWGFESSAPSLETEEGSPTRLPKEEKPDLNGRVSRFSDPGKPVQG